MIEPLRLKSNHPNAYAPGGCELSTVTGIFWDKERKRMAVSVIYDSGEADYIPLIEILGGNYDVLNKISPHDLSC
jgi:hypothetical protein